jgi:hypothetical protein
VESAPADSAYPLGNYTRCVLMILPPGHAQRVAQRRAFTRRERWILSGVSALFTALVVTVVVAIATSEPKSGHGCVYVTVASSMGAQPYSGCGARARSICSAVDTRGVYTGSLRRELIVACRKAGLPAHATS